MQTPMHATSYTMTTLCLFTDGLSRSSCKVYSITSNKISKKNLLIFSLNIQIPPKQQSLEGNALITVYIYSLIVFIIDNCSIKYTMVLSCCIAGSMKDEDYLSR